MSIDEKHFGESENKALEQIIDKLTVEQQNNFFDYYNDNKDVNK